MKKLICKMTINRANSHEEGLVVKDDGFVDDRKASSSSTKMDIGPATFNLEGELRPNIMRSDGRHEDWSLAPFFLLKATTAGSCLGGHNRRSAVAGPRFGTRRRGMPISDHIRPRPPSMKWWIRIAAMRKRGEKKGTSTILGR
jgi:hypothetical protein